MDKTGLRLNTGNHRQTYQVYIYAAIPRIQHSRRLSISNTLRSISKPWNVIRDNLRSRQALYIKVLVNVNGTAWDKKEAFNSVSPLNRWSDRTN